MKDKLLEIRSKCESLLLNYNKEHDAHILSKNSCDTEFLEIRMNLIVAILNKLDFLEMPFWENSGADYYMEGIVFTLLKNTCSWEAYIIDPEDVCEGGGEEEQQEEIKNFCSEIKKQTGVEIETNEDLERLICTSAFYNEENHFDLCIFLNKYIPDLIKSGDIDTKLLEALYYPVLLHPEANPYLSEDMSMSCFLIGTSYYYSQTTIDFSYMSYMLPVTIIYVEVAYRLKYEIYDRSLKIGDMLLK